MPRQRARETGFKVDKCKLVKGMRSCVVLLGLLATALRVHGNGQSCARTAPPARACGAGCLTADLLCHLRPWRSANPNKRTLGLRGGMMIYKDIVSGDEIVSDSFPIEEVDDVVLKVTTSMVVKDALNVNTGGNPSAEGGEDEAADDQVAKVNDVVDAFNLQSIGAMDKKSLLAWVKGYLKAIKERLDKEDPDRVAVFQEKSQKWVREKLLKELEDFEFFTGPSFDTEGALAMMIYEGENHAPHMYVFKDGLAGEKA